MVFVACIHVFLGGLVINLTAPWLAQLGECQSAEREVMGSNRGQTNTQGLQITEKKVLPL